MIRIPLYNDETALLLAPRWGELEQPWTVILLALLLVAPGGLVLWLYRCELRLVRRATALGLLALRVLLLILLWAVVGFQPLVARYHVEEEPSQVLVAVDASPSMDVVDPQRSTLDKLRLARALAGSIQDTVPLDLLDRWIGITEAKGPADETPWQDAESRDVYAKVLSLVDGLKRSEIAALLLDQGPKLRSRLAAQHKVQRADFDAMLWQVHEQQDAAQKRSRGQATDLGLPLRWALEQAGAKSERVLGLVLLTDGQHNSGASAIPLAREMGRRKIPVYPVALGARQPPSDLAVLGIQAPSDVFKGTEASVEAKVKISGVPAQDIVVELLHQGKLLDPEHKKILKHDGHDRTHTLAFQAKLEKLGAHPFEVKIHATRKDLQEVTHQNNALAATVRVIKDKAKVLLVDGEARWEYHYLANALGRDPAIALERVVFLQPRLGLMKEDVLIKLSNPRTKLPEVKDDKTEPLEEYDGIVLGDVGPEQLPLAERRRLERYVADRGGTLVMLAGKRHMPLDYLTALGNDEPLRKMIPLSDVKAAAPPSGFALTLTAEGGLTPFMQLDTNPAENRKRWAAFPKHFWGLVGKPKPGAGTLAFVGEAIHPGQAQGPEPAEKNQAILVQQAYGFGRVLFIGLDSTWRWRYREGDTYHHRFWGQVVRWAASDQLLPAGNSYVRFGSRLPVYRQGQEVEVALRLGLEVKPPAPGETVQMRVLRQQADGSEESASLVLLHQSEQMQRVFTAKIRDLLPGSYRLAPEVPGLEGKLPGKKESSSQDRLDSFVVLPPENGEMFDLAVNWDLLESLARQSGGEVFSAENAGQVVDRLARRVVRQEIRDDERPWQDPPMVWWLLALAVGILTVEWIWRKGVGLP